MADNILEIFLAKAGSIPGIQISRDDYLRRTFGREHKSELDAIILSGPMAAGIPPKEISKIADQAINSEAMKTIAVSAGTGVIGGPAALAAVPADILQFYGHVFRIMQKLMYLYGWEEDVFEGDGSIDDTTSKILVIYMGLMFGVGAAGHMIANITKLATKRVLRDIPMRTLKAILTKQAFREVLKKIIKTIGIRTAWKYSVVAGTKLVPIVGAVTSGALTAVFFIPMSRKLKRYFADGEMGRLED